MSKKPFMRSLLLALLLFVSCRMIARSNPLSSGTDIEYATVVGHPLKLDLYRPRLKVRSPLIVWVHGGAWRSGSKGEMPLNGLVDDGYAIASVDYRLSTEARFPAQVHDIKAAIRFLRKHAGDWDVSATTIVIAGNSAGGHLAALVGVSNGNAELEGAVGNCREESSAVQGIVSFYGASNLTTILKQSTPHGLNVRVPALELLLGGQPDMVPALARLASPVFHVDKNDPPLLLFHGDQDEQMPINQAHELCGAYEIAKNALRFEVVHGAGHGGSEFFSAERLAVVKDFLRQNF